MLLTGLLNCYWSVQSVIELLLIVKFKPLFNSGHIFLRYFITPNFRSCRRQERLHFGSSRIMPGFAGFSFQAAEKRDVDCSLLTDLVFVQCHSHRELQKTTTRKISFSVITTCCLWYWQVPRHHTCALEMLFRENKTKKTHSHRLIKFYPWEQMRGGHRKAICNTVWRNTSFGVQGKHPCRVLI